MRKSNLQSAKLKSFIFFCFIIIQLSSSGQSVTVTDNTADGHVSVSFNTSSFCPIYEFGASGTLFIYKNNNWVGVVTFENGSNNDKVINGYGSIISLDDEPDRTTVTFSDSPTNTYNEEIGFLIIGATSYLGSMIFYKPTKPLNLTATKDQCNINLTWNAPANIKSGEQNNYEIFVNGKSVESVDQTSYSYSNPNVGEVYDFTVRLNVGYSGNINTGEMSEIAKGNKLPKLPAPTNLTASDDRCDGKIKVQWQWTMEHPTNFLIGRSTNVNGPYYALNSSLPGDKNSYEDTNPARNVIYYYKVWAQNKCGDLGVEVSSPASGLAPDQPADPSDLIYSIENNVVRISWKDNSQKELNYEITRTNLNTGVTNKFELDANTKLFEDDNVQLCVPYEYELVAVNDCGNSNTVSTGNVILAPDLGNTFPANSFKASKGYYPDIVHLEWDNNNRSLINAYYIYRKVFESTDSTLLTTLDGSQASYDDEYAENGILYEYSIRAEGLCDTLSVWSDVASDIGFRNPSATVSGKITYGNGSPVKGITVTAESDDLLTTTSLVLDGSRSYLEIPDNSTADIQDNFSFQAYIRLSQLKSSPIFIKGNQYKLHYNESNFEFSVGTNVLSFAYSMPLDTFVHVSVTFDGSTSSLYINGKLEQTKSGVSSVSNNSSPFILGKFDSLNYFAGYMDEIRIWKEALDSTKVKNDFNRYISYRDNGLIGYYRLNENINSNLFFDISKSTLSFNENHGVMHYSSYSTVVPDKDQLWFRGLSNRSGDYLITGIPYFTDGSSFNIVPMLAPHEFNPSSKTLFVSDESQVHNNIDFTDISSFMVNGSVIYRNTTLGVKGVQVLIDGELVFGPDAKPEVTNEDGEFEILVPIGYHYISLSKPGHTFESGGRYPYDSSNPDSIVKHNFNQNLTFENPFIDTTLITVVGRVIGGTGSNSIPFGFDQSANNIGKATITLTHDSNSEPIFDNTGSSIGENIITYDVATNIDKSGNTTFTTIQRKTTREKQKTEISTSQTSGEFVARLIPEKFSVVEIEVDADVKNDVGNFFGNRVIDLSGNPGLKYEYLYDENDVLLDSIPYHLKLNYIYQTQPEIDVTNVGESDLFYGEDVLVYNNPKTGLDENIVVADHFKYPIFKTFHDYSPEISIFESYHNFDSGVDTRQSVKEAEIKIINDLAIKDNVKIYNLTPEMNGVIIDTFKVGIPNIALSVGDQTSFTKTLQINVTVDGNGFPWKPGGKFYRGYIMGQRPKGNNFYTEGPQIPEIILRDPPGSNSYAYIEKGSSYTVSSQFSTDYEAGSGLGVDILLGVKMEVGGGLAGPVMTTDNKNTSKTGLAFSTSVNESGEYVQSFSFSERVETSSDPGVVGSMGDIYIGKSYNYFYGETDNLKIIPKDLAESTGVIALDNSELKDSSYTLGIVEGYIMNPDNSDTYFKYTQAHIVNKLLPELEDRRNNLFLTSKRSDGTLKYTPELTDPGDIRYGIAHTFEVEITGSDTIMHGYYKMTDSDSIETYSFRPEQETIADLNNIQNDTIYEIDSIRYYNSQINIWIDAIRLNETEKATAIEGDGLEQNISFDGAVGSITRKETQTISYNKSQTRTKNFDFSAAGSLGFRFNGVGVVSTGTLQVKHLLGANTTDSRTQSLEYGYVLDDGDVGDYYSINVYRRSKEGIYNAKNLEETKLEQPGNFDYGILGGAVGGGKALGGAFVSTLVAYFSSSTFGASTIFTAAGAMTIGAGLSFKPYTSFMDEVQGKEDDFEPGEIRIGSFDISSPIFSTLGGQTMCPFQDLEHTFFYKDAQGDSVVLHKPTLQREKPEITAEPAEVLNVPITDQAFFNIKLTNNTESGDDQWYTVSIVEKSNPYGAAVKIDGVPSNKTILVPANETVTKSLTIAPTNKSIMNYDSIGIVIHSTCQYDPTDFIPDISDTVFISASFQPACTNVEILEPLDNWVVNVEDHDTMTIRIGGYNLAYDSFQSFRFEYKSSSASSWNPGKYFVNDPLLANKDEVQDTILIDGASFVTFDWSMTGLKDRAYDLRVVSNCTDGSENESTILSGILDGLRPQVFGTPQPADGILNIDENISVRFNEPIEGGLLKNQFNFDVKGTLNYSLLKQEAYVRLNGSTDYLSIPEGISFNDKSFTIEFWMRPDNYDDAVIFSQGNDPASSLEIGLKNRGTYFKIGNVEYTAPFEFSDAVPAEAWQHMAYVYDYENGDIYIYQNDKIILEIRSVSVIFNNSGKIYLGKSSLTGGDNFAGSLHELRIWSKYLDKGEFYANQSTVLSGNEVGLYGYWPIDEAFGPLAIDKAANRHMEVYAPWEAYPGGSSWNFAGNNYLEFNTGYFSIIPEMDFTMEFWFKDNNPTDTVTLFSNHKGDGTDSDALLDKALSVIATPDGKIWVASKGNLIEVVSNDYFDDSWHHFAMVVRRSGNVISFIDGEAQNERENSIVGGIAGAKMYIGARKWNNINGTGEDWYYDGKLDEFRLWNLAKTTTQIRMDMNSKLYGDEIGLMVYFPFEGYYKDSKGISHQTPTLENFVTDVNATDAVANGANAYTTDAPNMKDVRPVQSIAYDRVASEDEIIITPKAYLFPQLEKNIIEITVQGVEDKFGNRMASPVTWTAYVHRNQVRWEDERRIFTKELYKPFDFVSTIKNTGGQQVGFTITNLPPWLTVNPSSGNINPESTLDISFTINPALNIGEYNEDIILRTENGFDEKLPITVRVHKPAPDWKVDPSKFESTMNMIGRVKIEGVLSTDIFDKVAVFVNDSIRGVANVRYLVDFDSYLLFLNVYGNIAGENLDFRIWDASVGQILDNVSPFDVTFVPNGVEGSTLDPVIFEATGLYRQYIPMAKGWNWVSFNKWSSNQDNLNSFFASLEPQQNDQIKTHGTGYNNYDLTTGWAVGLIDSIDNRQMYQIKLSNKDTLVYSGADVIPEDNPITLTAGWNHVGYLPDLAMDVNDALRLYVADTSEIIKSQYAFSMFDPRAGWLGTLDVMQPGLGYMMNVKKDGVLTYPNSTIFKGARILYSSSPPNGWNSDLSKYSGNLSIVAKIHIESESAISVNSEMVLGAFINGECHGFVNPLSNVGIGYEPFFLNVSNDSHGQTIKFRVFDGLTGNTYKIKETKPFVQNAIYGTTQNPLELTIEGMVTNSGAFDNESFMRCYPNPFNDQINVEFAGMSNSISIDVVNTTGSVVQQLFEGYPTNGTNKVIWNGRNQNGTTVSSGIYYIRFVSDDSVETVKISKTR